MVRKRRFLTRKVIETVLPFSYGNFRGVMRIGIDAENYDSLKSKVFVEVSLLFFVLLLILVFSYFLVFRMRKAETGYAALKEILQGATIPVYIKNKDRIYPVNSVAGTVNLSGVQLKDGEIISLDGVRYMVKSFRNNEQEYFILISLELEDMKRRLMEYEAISNLIAEVAHEIKNPLNGISLIVQSLLVDEDKDEYKDILKQTSRIEESINRFVSLLSPLRLRKECVSQREIIDEALKETGISRVRKVVIEGDTRLMCDRARVKEAYLNIIKNAYEATDDGDVIKISIDKDAVVFENRGQIDEKDLKHIFDPFYTTKEQGSGIGMYYVRKVIESHGWRIKVKNLDGKVEVKIEFNENSHC